MEVSGVPHCQGYGAVGDVSPVRKRSIVPLAGGTAHLNPVMAHGVEYQYTDGITILGEPGRSVPHEEGGGVPLLTGGVYLL